MMRDVKATSSGIQFMAGYGVNGTNSASSAANCVPYKIYGIKTSIVIPTEVHGMQYVEVE